MTSRGQSWRLKSPGKSVWILLASPLLSIAAGSVIGAGVFTLVNLWRSGATGTEIVGAYSAFLLYSLLVTVPFGGAAGLVAAVIIIGLGNGSYRGASLRRWLRTGGALGAVVGLTCPVVLASLGFGDDSSRVVWFLVYGAIGSIAGVLVGLALGALAWRDFGATAPSRIPC